MNTIDRIEPHAPSRVICETALTRVIYAPCRGDEVARSPGPLIITFPPYGAPLDGFRFWADNLFVSCGVSAIGLVSKQVHWYLPDEFERLLPALLQIVERHKPAKIVTIGNSMAATQALRHARALGADITAAFSPLYSHDPAIIGGFDQRRKRTFDPALHTGFKVEADGLAPLTLLFYDPLSAWDREHAKRILELSQSIRRVLTTGTGHFSVMPFRATEQAFDSLLDLLVGNEADIARRARLLVRRWRGRTADYCEEMSKFALHRRRAALAAGFARRAVELQPHNLRRKLNLSKVLRSQDRLQDVQLELAA